MKTIICKETKEQFYGKVISGPKIHVNIFGEIVDFWIFETVANGEYVEWKCLSDYWELVDTDLRKVTKVLTSEDSSEVGILEKIKQILKWGCCK